jgi:hypothetical protein
MEDVDDNNNCRICFLAHGGSFSDFDVCKFPKYKTRESRFVLNGWMEEELEELLLTCPISRELTKDPVTIFVTHLLSEFSMAVAAQESNHKYPASNLTTFSCQIKLE